MRNKKLLVYITLILLLMMLSLMIHALSSVNTLPISLCVDNNDKELVISGWESEDTWFFFLPSFSELSEVRINLESETVVNIGGFTIHDGMDCAQFSLNQPYKISYSVWGNMHQSNLVLLKSEGIATAYIETQSGNMEYLHENKENSEPGAVKIFTDSGVLEYAGEIVSISGRGNASWTETEKKSYSVTLAEPSDLLNMGKANRWILLANALDETHLRNKIVYDMGQAIELAYTADSEWIDLYLNGQYAGLYLLIERNEVHPERVDISQEGSFLVSGEMEDRLVNQNIPYILTNAKQAMRIHYPLEMDGVAAAELTRRLQSVENAILAEDSIDPVSGKKLEELIDLDSFVKRYLLDEVFGNIDGGAFSQFYYYDGSDASGKLHAGPAWDYDLSMGSDYMWQSQNPEAFYANRPGIKQGIDSKWIYALCQKAFFSDRVIEMYRTYFLPFLEKSFYDKVSFYEKKLDSSAYMDQIRWKYAETFHDNVEALLVYMNQRQKFLNAIWLEGKIYHCVTFIQGQGYNNAYYMIRSGEYIQVLPELKDTEKIQYKGWYSIDSDDLFDISRPITEDIQIYAKWEETPSNNIGKILQLFPLGMIVFVGFSLLLVDVRKNRRSRWW